MIGEVSDSGIVVDADPKNKTITDEGDAKEIEFYLDIMCCDPNDTECKACESTELDATPIMKIGPNSNAESRFYVETGMNTHNRELGYFHLERLYYQGFDENDTLVGEFDVIENGCNEVGALVEFNGDNRVNKTSEGFYIAPFLSGSGTTEKFTLTAEVISCPLGPFEDRCELGDCTNRYSSAWYPGTSSKVTRRRRSVFENGSQSETEIIQMYHPCHVVTEDKPYCIIDENGEQGKGYNSNLYLRA